MLCFMLVTMGINFIDYLYFEDSFTIIQGNQRWLLTNTNRTLKVFLLPVCAKTDVNMKDV